jgi:FAD/FMN-containing dehydrogenase
MSPWSSLRSTIAGTVVEPGQPDWDAARQAWNLVADQRPAAVVRAAAPGDLAATVRFAAANGLRVAPQTTGHSAVTLGDLSDTILLRTGDLADVAVDPEGRTARVQAGARWTDVVAAATGHGLACLHGSSAGVGVAGYTLGGGLGWLTRSHGFASTFVRSLDVVTADGEERRVDAEHEPDLFWALRGGGSSGVVVAALEFELVPLAEAFAGVLMWPLERAPEVVEAYRAWTATVPDSVMSTIKLLRFPPVDLVPEPLRGRRLVAITLASTDGDGEALVAPLRAVGERYIDQLGTIPAGALGGIAGDPEGPLPGLGASRLLDRFSGDAAAAYLELAGPDAETPFVGVEVRHLGGALRSPERDPGAAGAVAEEAIVYAVGTPVSPEVGAAIGGAVEQLHATLAPFTGSRDTLLTFDERDGGVRGAFSSEVADRLARIRRDYDPEGRVVANHVAG